MSVVELMNEKSVELRKRQTEYNMTMDAIDIYVIRIERCKVVVHLLI